jgi:phage terminase large subunit-like protein
VAHLRHLGALEEQMCKMTAQGYLGKSSPDRLDALVWALTELMVEPSENWRAPKVRSLG